ncbi:MAG: hypothetical protein AABM67_20835, partial [Acidobacteriota bacterium]
MAGAPQLVTDGDSTRAIAIETPTGKAEPFLKRSVFPWALDSSDRQTRISLFAMNLDSTLGDSASTITVDAEDVAHNHYVLTVEHLGEVPGYPWLHELVVKLSENLDDNAGDLLVSINAHGLTSNRARVGIGFVGSGLPDDSLPMPAPNTNPAGPVPPVPTISGFELHDAANNVYPLTNGTQLILGSMPEPLQIYALAGPNAPSSVRSKLGSIDDRVTSAAPYATRQFTLGELGLGTIVLMATGYTGPNARGLQGVTLPISFQVVGAAPSATPTPTPTPPPTPTPSPTATPTSTPTPTPTPSPSPTPQSTPTPTPVPTPSLTSVTSLIAQPDVLIVGNPIIGTFSTAGPVNSTDLIGVYKASAGDGQYMSLSYVSAAVNGVMTMTSPSSSDTYNLRYLARDPSTTNNYYVVARSNAFVIVSAPTPTPTPVPTPTATPIPSPTATPTPTP